MTNLIDEFPGLIRLVVGASMAIVGAKMNDETLKAVGLVIVGGVIGMTIPGMVKPRDTSLRTRATDKGGES